MTRVVILGAGISGHTAALHLQRQLKRKVEIVVVSPNSNWNWIPSNIWVGVGKMTKEQVTFPLAPIYTRKHIGFRQAKAVAIHPEGDAAREQPFVDIVYTDPAHDGEHEQLAYDYLIVATGPKLNFAATPGLGPDAAGEVLADDQINRALGRVGRRGHADGRLRRTSWPRGFGRFGRGRRRAAVHNRVAAVLGLKRHVPTAGLKLGQDDRTICQPVAGRKRLPGRVVAEHRDVRRHRSLGDHFREREGFRHRNRMTGIVERKAAPAR